MQNQSDPAAGANTQPAHGLDPALLADLTRALLPYLGPYSITTVKRAARSTNDPHNLVRQVATHLDDIAKREMFMKSAMRILADYVDSEPAAVADDADAQADPAARMSGPMTPELLQRGQAALAPLIGPLAGVLVSRYARSSQNSREFFDRLAGHLRTPEERDRFFLSVRTGTSNWRPQ
jgi:hypothetical protein